MIVESFNICTEVSEQMGIEYDMVKAINDTIFRTLNKEVRLAKNLRIKLQRFGTWYFRRKAIYDRPVINKNNIETQRDDQILFDAQLDRIMEVYDIYVEERLQNKYKKYGKENYEAYVLALKTKEVPGTEEDRP